MSSKLHGTGIALVTPFQNGIIDFDGLERVINHTIEGGVEYLVSLGTTGETPTLSKQEQKQVLEFTVKTVAGRVPIVAGFGGNNTAQLVEEIKNYHFKGVDFILSSSPNYNKPTQEGIFQHYMAIAEVAPVPVIIYNVPGRTARNISAETTIRLAKASDKFCAIKEASGDMEQCMKIARDKPEDFLLLSGDDALTLPMISFGAKGVISVIGNALPREFSDMIRYCLDSDFKAAKPLHFALLETVDLIFRDGNPSGVKGLLEMQSICSKEVRLPLTQLTEATNQALKVELEKIKHLELIN
jgi:4-hydroxy-tetrahydrodipicolinate synthase